MLRGTKHTKESKAKMSIAHSGENNHSFGKHLSEEHKAKISAINTGKKRSKETKMKQSVAKSGKNNPMYGKKRLLSGENNPMYGKRHTHLLLRLLLLSNPKEEINIITKEEIK